MSRTRYSAFLFALVIGVGPATTANGQTWDGGGANDAWTTPLNWNTNVAPVNDGTANVAFRGSVRLTPVVNVQRSVNSITFLSPSGSFDISNSFHIDLTVGAGGITNGDNSLQTIEGPILLAAAQTWRANTGPLAVTVVAGSGFPLTIDGNFDTTIGRILAVGAALVKNGPGTLTINNSGTYAGGTSVNAGVLQASNPTGSATGSGAVSVTGSGILRGTGIIAGPVQNDGTVKPGDTIGTLTIQNTYSQGTGGSLSILVGGPADTDHTRLTVTDAATLSGGLTVTLVNGYIPVRGDAFEILTAGSVTGEFSTLNLPPIGANAWQVEYGPTSVLLTVSTSAVISYQGRLKNGGQLAAGNYDFQFRLFDAATGGNQVAGTQCVDNVPVSEGIFGASVDFGDQYSTPVPRFLEVRARADTGLDCSNPAGFSIVGARQRILPSPGAAHAAAAFALDAPDGSHPNALFVDNAGQIGIGTTTPLVPLHLVTSGEALRLQGPAVGAANSAWIGFNDSGGTQTGVVGDAISGDNGIYLASAVGDVHLYAGAAPALTAKVGGNVGIGTTSPTAKLDVRGEIALGSSGQFRAAAGDFRLYVVRGVIHDVAGGGGATIQAGSGFTMSSSGGGHYHITFTPPFSATPSVTATAQGFGDDFFTRCFAMTQSVTPTGADLEVHTQDNGDFVPRPIHFIAVGLR